MFLTWLLDLKIHIFTRKHKSAPEQLRPAITKFHAKVFRERTKGKFADCDRLQFHSLLMTVGVMKLLGQRRSAVRVPGPV